MDDSNHPALQGYSEPVELVKHVGGSMIKSGAKWALIGAAALLALGLLFAVSNPIGWVAGLATLVTGHVGTTLGALAMTGLEWGAVAGATIGGVSAVADSSDYLAQQKDELKANYERAEVRQMRVANMQQRQQMQALAMQNNPAGMGVSPNLPQMAETGAGRNV